MAAHSKLSFHRGDAETRKDRAIARINAGLIKNNKFFRASASPRWIALLNRISRRLLDRLLQQTRQHILQVLERWTQIRSRTNVGPASIFLFERSGASRVAAVFLDVCVRCVGARADLQRDAVTRDLNSSPVRKLSTSPAGPRLGALPAKYLINAIENAW